MPRVRRLRRLTLNGCGYSDDFDGDTCMRHLEKLNVSKRVVAAARPRSRVETVEYRRKKLIANIEEQIELANLTLKGMPLQLDRKRGHQVTNVRPRIWWQTEPDGKVYAQIRYNKVALNIGGRGTTIEVGALRKVPTTYRIVIRAVKAGELDHAIEVAARKSRPR